MGQNMAFEFHILNCDSRPPTARLRPLSCLGGWRFPVSQNRSGWTPATTHSTFTPGRRQAGRWRVGSLPLDNIAIAPRSPVRWRHPYLYRTCGASTSAARRIRRM